MTTAYCPHCRHDVRVAASSAAPICPECGKRFRVTSDGPEKLSSDWSMAEGLRSLAVAVVVRLILCAPLAAVGVYVAGLLPVGSSGRYHAALPILAGVLPGLACGYLFARGLEERAGFAGLLLYTMVVIAAGALSIGAWLLVDRVFPALPGHTTGIGAFGFGCAFVMTGCHVVYDEG